MLHVLAFSVLQPFKRAQFVFQLLVAAVSFFIAYFLILSKTKVYEYLASCNGDSGGPLTVTTELGVVLIGAASFVASGGCDRGVPAGYARVTSFLTWIEQNSVE